ncbi:MFS transporter [Limosilactobacillus secaliphilus]|uniref:Major facilitator superfamily protein n=1 Tax=Limosilactobacillus secaliphilus TaxID=396268 RepID=A0A0R2I3R5_9LACO|nr:MFS transporter [Limosilactobacillus secaliphilus]KRN59470.1 major facilitator superfamily protein [Limosilactobacillus secaliphilus]
MNKEESEHAPFRVGVGLFVGVMSWILPYIGVNNTLLPAKVQAIDPSGKVQIIAELATMSMIVAAIANVVLGALSDRTHTRLGKRTPWIIGGEIVSMICFALLTTVNSIAMLFLIWAVYQIGLNGIVAPLIAILSDMVPKKFKGTISSFYGIAMSIGNPLATIIAARFITRINVGLWSLLVLQAILTVICLLCIHEPNNLHEQSKPLHGRELLEAFIFPLHGDIRDFYLAVFGKLFFVAAHFVIVGYQLYIFTDYMKLNPHQAAGSLSMMSTFLLITGLIFAAVSGPVADRIHSIKKVVAVSTICLGVGVLFPLFDPAPWTMFAYAIIGGSAIGIYNSVDQALNVTVLPNKNNAAKDLGIMNLANTLGQILGPVVASITITSLGYHAIFAVAGIMCLFGACLIMLIKSVK